MPINKLSRIFTALGQPSQSYNSSDSTSQRVETSKAPASEAVEVSASFDVKEGDQAQKSRVADIKAAVNNGTYKVDTQAVAEAFAREVFA